MAWGKRAALGHFVPSGWALFPSGIFQLCSNYYKAPQLHYNLTLIYSDTTNFGFITVLKAALDNIGHRCKHSQIWASNLVSDYTQRLNCFLTLRTN